MTDNETTAGPDLHVNFDARAVLRKWPSLNNRRRTDSTGPYLLLDGTLDECIREFFNKQHLSQLIDLGLVEMRDDTSYLTVAGQNTVWPDSDL